MTVVVIYWEDKQKQPRTSPVRSKLSENNATGKSRHAHEKVRKGETREYPRRRALAVGSRSPPGQTWEGESANLKGKSKHSTSGPLAPKKLKRFTVFYKEHKAFSDTFRGARRRSCLCSLVGVWKNLH